MDKVNLPDGRWFDRDEAKVFDESTEWDGSNYISCATGSQWEHEELIRTPSGVWILHSWSQWQGSRPDLEEISESEAHRWLIRHGHSAHIPKDVVEAMKI